MIFTIISDFFDAPQNFLYVGEWVARFAVASFFALCITRLAGKIAFKFVNLPDEMNLLKTFFKLVPEGLIYFFFTFYGITNYLHTPFIGTLCAMTIFYFALSISIITDYYTYLMSTLVTTYLIPIFFFYAFKGYLVVGLQESIISVLLIWVGMKTISRFFEWKNGTTSIGEGDIDLLMLIASAVGIMQTLSIIMYASIIGSIWGIYTFYIKREPLTEEQYMIPFGTCLGYSAYITYILHFYNIRLF